MNIIKLLKENNILVVPNTIKEKILEELDLNQSLIDVKIMNIEELKKRYYFDYNDETIFRLMKKYDIKMDVAKVYLENMYYLNDCYYESDKLNQLTLKKKFLLDNHLLVLDPLFKILLKKRHIIVYGYDYLNKFQLEMLNNIKQITDVEIFLPEIKEKKDLTVHEFSTIDEEIEYIANCIIELTNKNISLSRIKLANVDKEYIKTIEKIFSFYQIPVSLKNNPSIYSSKIVSSFLSFIESGLNIKKSLERITLIYGNKEDHLELINKIIEVCNNFVWYQEDCCKILDLLIEKFKSTTLKEPKLETSIELITLENNQLIDDDYIFLVGFNNGIIPKLYKDEDFISDALKNEIQIETTMEKNRISTKQILQSLYRIPNLTITYKLKTPFETYYPSILIESENMNVITNHPSSNTIYAPLLAKIKLTNYLDRLIKYGEVDNNLPKYYKQYNNMPYCTYDNKFTGINSKKFVESLNKKLVLAYSSIDQFSRCGFRYYMNYIIKVQKYEESFAIQIGNIFHELLSIAFDSNFDLDLEFDKRLKNYTLTKQQQFFCKKLKEELRFIIEAIESQHKLTGFTKMLFEKKIYLNKEKTIPVTFMGVIDKLLYKEEDDRTLVSIIDYKTGNTSTDMSNTIYGIGMQLPVYIYLARNMVDLKNVQVSGFYLQKILNTECPIQKNKTYNDQKLDNLKLVGYSTAKESILEKFDPSYEDSTLIKSMKTSSKGFSSYAKVLEDSEMDELYRIVENRIDKSIDSILNADFLINPKRVGGKIIGCDFCSFQDLCYKKEKDIVDLKEYKGLDFLGGDDNA